MAIRIDGESKSGPIHGQHFQSTFTCSQHAPADALAKPYEEIAQIVTKAMQSIQKESPVYGVDDRSYTEDEVKKQVKFMLLAMQGSWTQQHHYCWKVQNSMYDEDCEGRVYMWRPSPDNTRRLMSRSETLTNRTMFLIGRMALDAEHCFLWQLHKRMSTIFPPMRFHGCINDCLFVTGVEHEQIEYALEHDCKPDEAVPAEKAYYLFWPHGPFFALKSRSG